MLSEVHFAAYLAYSPRGTSEMSRRSRAICHGLKQDKASEQANLPLIEYVVDRLAADQPRQVLPVLGSGRTLVPMPRSAPFPPRETNVLWVPRRIAEVLVARGLGAGVAPVLERITAVPKSAFAAPGERPSVQAHYDSLRVHATLESPTRITIVDDVVTRGRTFLAAASRLKEAYPDAEVSCLALVRTRGLVPEILNMVDPIYGTIRYVAGDAQRLP